MKRGLLIFIIIAAICIVGAVIFDALQAKPERRILTEENYVPPKVQSPKKDERELTPMPGK